MKFSPLLLAALGATALSAAPARADDGPFAVESSAALVSDYRWRGLSMSDQDPSLQVEATVSHESGAWLWTGANSVSEELGGSELGVGAGYTLSLGGVDWSLGATRYLYPGEIDIDYTELAFGADVSLGPATLSAGVEYAPEQDNYETDDTYLWVGAEIDASRGLRLHGHVGRDDGIMAPTEEPSTDFSLGAAFDVSVAELDLSYVEADSVDQALVFSIVRRR